MQYTLKKLINLGNFSERIDKYNQAVKSKDGSGADPGALQISPQEVYSVFAKFKRDRFEQWDKGFVSFLKQKVVSIFVFFLKSVKVWHNYAELCKNWYNFGRFCKVFFLMCKVLKSCV